MERRLPLDNRTDTFASAQNHTSVGVTRKPEWPTTPNEENSFNTRCIERINITSYSEHANIVFDKRLYPISRVFGVHRSRNTALDTDWLMGDPWEPRFRLVALIKVD